MSVNNFLKVSEMRFCFSNRVSTCHRSTAAERCALSKLGSMRIFHSLLALCIVVCATTAFQQDFQYSILSTVVYSPIC